MMRIFFPFLLFFIMTSICLPNQAVADPPGPPTGVACDFTALKNAITQTESGGGGCGYSGSTDSSQGSTAGKYQFVAGTWATMVRGCPNEANCPHSAVSGNAACCEAEECAMNNLLASNMNAARSIANCQAILGKTITAPQQYIDGRRVNEPTTCTVNMAGILAAMHLGGSDACDGPATGGYGDDDCQGSCVGTYEATYMCHYSKQNLPVPGDCTPQQQGDPNQGAPIGTIWQIEIQEGQGDTIVTGSANGLIENWITGLMLMAEQFTANMAYQVQLIGKLLDAKHQLETQRLFQEKVSEAHKDYHPSEQMCTFGTFTRDLMATSRNADLAKAAISHEMFQREVGSGDSKGASAESNSLSRIAQFRKSFCNPKDNGNGLTLLCPTPAPVETQNADIDFTRTIDQPMSLEINPTDNNVTPDEEAVFALVDNLFAHSIIPRISSSSLEQRKFQYHYANLRSIIAMRGIARNSISNIISLKTATPNNEATGASSAPYLRALFREFGLPDEEIIKILGEHPSYNAQMELLTKKIYQSPAFYTNLYDKPANVKRIRAAMRAIKLMQDRDILASLHRREMLLSMMLELRLREKAENVYSAAEAALFDSQ